MRPELPKKGLRHRMRELDETVPNPSEYRVAMSLLPPRLASMQKSEWAPYETVVFAMAMRRRMESATAAMAHLSEVISSKQYQPPKQLRTWHWRRSSVVDLWLQTERAACQSISWAGLNTANLRLQSAFLL
jgi:hypothetical protein